MKKKRQNGKRSRTPGPNTEPTVSGAPEDPEETETRTESDDSDQENAEDLEFDEGMVEHIQMMTGLIEEREVSHDEVVAMLRRLMRQHSLGGEKRLDYILRYLKENPPEGEP